MARRFSAAALLAVLFLGCDAGKLPPMLSLPGTATVAPPSDTITVATFNIQVFGTAKEEKRAVWERLAEVIRRFDVVAIQEIRCHDPDFLERFVAAVNAKGRNYGYAIGPRLGRTSSKEQYAFLYDRDRIEIARKTVYTLDDRYDYLHREPFVARFRVIGPPAEKAFTFTLIDIHTDPDEVEHELNALDDAVMAVANDGSGEDDVILLGDLNAPPGRWGELGRLPSLAWAISGEPTNVRRTAAYDDILFDSRRTTEYTGRSGVFDLEAEFGLSRDEALELSDHLPVWAEFTATESHPTVATSGRPGKL